MDSIIAAACYDGSIHGWSNQETVSKGTSNFLLSFAYKAHLSCVKCLAISSSSQCNINNGKMNKSSSKWFLASGGTDEIIHVYDLHKLKEVGELIEHSDTVLALAFVKNEFLLSGGNDGKLCLWRCRDWNCVANLRGHKAGPVTSIAVHPSGGVALSTSNDDSLRMWNLETARPASRNRLRDYKCLDMVTWSHDGDGYALIADSRVLLFFIISDQSGNPKSTLEFESRVNSLCFLSGAPSRIVVGLENGIIMCYNYSITDNVDVSSKVELKCNARIRSVKECKLEDGSAGVLAALSTGEVRFWNVNERAQVGEPLQVGSDAHLTCMVSNTTCSLGVTKVDNAETQVRKRKEEKCEGRHKLAEKRSFNDPQEERVSQHINRPKKSKKKL